MLERALQRHLITYIRKHGAFVRKIEAPGNAGMPDLLIIHQGRTMFLELKTDTGKLSPLQSATLKELEIHGAHAAVSFGFDHAKRIVDQFFDACKS